jgi:hypothetical protein
MTVLTFHMGIVYEHFFQHVILTWHLIQEVTWLIAGAWDYSQWKYNK